MPEYIVTRKSDGAEMIRYSSSQVVEQINDQAYPLADFDHIVLIEGAPSSIAGPRRLSKLQFIERMGDAAYISILQMAKMSVDVEAFVKRFEYATPESDGTSVDLDDPRTVAGVTALGAILEEHGVVASGWANEVLNG